MSIAYYLRHRKITGYAPLLKIKINRVGCYGMRHVTDAVRDAVSDTAMELYGMFKDSMQ